MAFDGYIKIASLVEKLQQAERERRTIYISGMTGYGKTLGVKRYYKKQPHIYVTGKSGMIEGIPSDAELQNITVIVDDLGWLEDEKSKQFVLDVCQKEDVHVVLINRGRVPGWLSLQALNHNFVFANETDCQMKKKEIKSLIRKMKLDVEEEYISKIQENFVGHPVTTRIALNMLGEYGGFTEDVIENTFLEVFRYYDEQFWNPLSEEAKTLFLNICKKETFSLEFCEYMCKNINALGIVEYAQNTGNYIWAREQGQYCFRPAVRRFIIHKQGMLWTPEQIRDNVLRVGKYYEQQGLPLRALEIYSNADEKKAIQRLLIEEASFHVGEGHFYELRKYYKQLDDEIVEQSLQLMSALCMLQSVLFNPEESEYWLEKISAIEKNRKLDENERKLAKMYRLYLELALPHKGIRGVVKIIKNSSVLLRDKELKMPAFSVTGNCPSLMNGGLDFSDWSRNDKAMAVMLHKPIEIVLGSTGRGLVDIAMAESGFEKNTMASEEIFRRLSSGAMMVEVEENLQMSFAANGLLAKEHLRQGQIEIAERLINDFYETTYTWKNEYLKNNVRAMQAWIKNLQGDIPYVTQWMEETPNENVEFNTMERYRYIQKVRGYILLGRREDALNLIEKLNLYFQKYERHYLWMENQILKAIIQYRSENEKWRETIQGAIDKARYYHFVRVIAQEGNAVRPLIQAIIDETETPDGFMKEVLYETQNMARNYPNYMRGESVLLESLTNMEKQILKLLCEGISSEEICSLCCISYSTLKFHNRNLYKKMGVKNRLEAERKASRLGLTKGRTTLK